MGRVLEAYDEVCGKRGLALSDLRSESLVYQEQRALLEALVRLGARKVLPALLSSYEVLEVERLDQELLWEEGPEEEDLRVLWRSIPDGLLRKKDSEELLLLSWKTSAGFPRNLESRVDTQGVSELWALRSRLAREGRGEEAGRLRGVQMVWLLKGRKTEWQEGEDQGKPWRHSSPLVWGLRKEGFPPEYAWDTFWRCSEAHSMRKSKWYPKGECPGDGRKHKRSGEWELFPVWEAGGPGVKGWMDLLESGEAGLGALPLQFLLGVPNYRPSSHLRSWLRSARAQESKVAANIEFLRDYEEELRASPRDLDLQEKFLGHLDELFPQHTEHFCENTYGRPCPARELCWGPSHVGERPELSGLYQLRTPMEEERASLEEVP